jgi:hypothetical protein
MPLNDTGKNVALDGLDEGITAGVGFIGVFQSSADPGTGSTYTGTEATGGSPAYARKAVTWGAAASGQKSNSGALTFDVPAGSYFAFGLFNAVSGNAAGNFMGYLPFGGATKGYGTVDSAGVTADLIQSAAHGLTTDDRVMVYNVFAESLPAGLTEGTLYYVLASGLTTDAFKLSTTSGGSAAPITAVGELFFQKFVIETFGAQGQITAAPGALVLDATAM